MSKENNKEYGKLSIYTMVASWFILAINLYYYGYPLFANYGLSNKIIMKMMLDIRQAGIFDAPFITKSVAMLLCMLGGLLRTGKSTNKGWWHVIILLVIGVILYIIKPAKEITLYSSVIYIVVTILGYTLMSIGFFYLSRKFKGNEEKDENDETEDTFEQCRKKLENKYSVNIPMRFHWKKKWWNGWLNIVNGARAVAIMGSPGSGKSYSIIEPVLEQGAQKSFCMFVYDYKYPSLSRIAYNEVRCAVKNGAYKDKTPTFGVVNFKDPRFSNRCNPLRPEYITDPADTTEIAELVMQNVNKAAVEKEDFFSMSAKVYLDALLWYLKIYCPPGGRPGDYCTFPHVIELMGQDYKKVFEILKSNPELEVKITPFINALEGGAQDQLQGQIASAQIPLNKFVSPALYWVLSANEINLDINNPEHPTILCVGNDPERQSIYGTTLALIAGQMFKIINKEKRQHTMIILDEAPTIILKGLRTIIDTGRSNKLHTYVGMQDMTQLEINYGKEEAKALLNVIANHIIGQASGDTAQRYNHMMGKHKKVNKSISKGEDNESTSISKHDEDRAPIAEIETLSQGWFIGKLADNNGQKNKFPLFYCEVQRPDFDTLQQQRKDKGWQDIPMINDFGVDEIDEQIKKEFDELIYDYCEQQYLNEKDDPSTINPLRLEQEVQEIVNKKKENEYEITRIRAEIREQLWKKKVKDTLDENYRNIKQDIKNLVEQEYGKVIERKSEQTRKLKENKMDNLLTHHRDVMLQRNARNKNKDREEQEDE